MTRNEADYLEPLPSIDDYDDIPGYAYLGEPRTPVSYFIPRDIEARINGAVRYAGDTGAIDHLHSKTDLLRLATHQYVQALEQQYNDGQPFKAAPVNNRGRGTDRTEEWVKVSSNFPVSLRDRINGAARFAHDTEQIPGVTSGNRLVAAACESYLAELEREHHRGRPFKDPRRRLPAGRTPR